MVLPKNPPLASRSTNMVDKVLSELYEDFRRRENTGRLANYIPELSKVNPGNFSIVLTTIDGHQYAYGDSEIEFTIQSVSKPFIYGMALQEHGVGKVLEKISVEPTGDAFNSISLYPDSGRPFNPMINAGAIAATDMVWQQYGNETFDRILDNFSTYAGSPLKLDANVYRSESETGHRNRAIAHLLRNFNILQSEVEAPLEIYFKQCSINVTCRQLSIMGATLANHGMNPITGKKALKSKYVPSVLSVMASCGMYDYSGEWIYNVGLPAKSGVGGAVLAVLPGQLAIAVYSPPLDKKGNSVFGVDFCKAIAQQFSLHLYKSPRQIRHVIRRQLTLRTARSKFKRDLAAEALFEKFGDEFHVMELQSDLYFATCEVFMRKISGDARILILNVHRCTTIDEGALRLIHKLYEEFQQSGRELYITNFTQLDLLNALSHTQVQFLRFKELDDVVFHLENIMLDMGCYEMKTEPIRLIDQQLLRGLSQHEVDELAKHVVHKTYRAGETIITKGTTADHIFFIESGRVSIHDAIDGKRDVVLALISAGNSFGEMALLDKQSRSADVKAQTDVTCFVMLYDILDTDASLTGIKVKLLTNLGAILSSRLRAANKEIASFM